ncbi:MAG: PAS domain S-box protein [Candidatus Omnitrophica bacterium]|nr:PAS domain S-box protein [Candidatus Omnitrophota bacterium]
MKNKKKTRKPVAKIKILRKKTLKPKAPRIKTGGLKEKIAETIIQHSAIAIFVINAQHKVIYWNKACEELTGLKAKSLIGTSNHWKAFYDACRPCLADIIIDNKFSDMARFYQDYGKSTLIRNGLHAEGWYLKLNGKDRYLVFDAAPVYNNKGKLIAAVEMLQDNSEFKKVESKLQENEQKMRAVFDQTFQFIGLMTLDGILIEANKTALELIGTEASEVLGKPFWQAPWWTHSPELQEKLRQAVKKAAEGKFIRFEATHLDKEGAVHNVDFSLKPVKDKSGKVIFLLPEGRDITEFLQAERLLKESEEDLRKVYIEFKQTQAELIQSEKMAALGKLASNIAHEIKNPLAINLQGLEYLKSIVPSDKVCIDTIESLIQANLRADKILKDLLNFARPSAPLILEEVDVPSLINSSLFFVDPQTNLNNVKITRVFAPDLPKVKLDHNQMQQVLINIFINAFDAMPQGGNITVIASQAEDVSHKKSLQIIISDTGCGIREDDMRRIFGPFFSTKQEKGGTGLGLAISKAIIESHRGTLEIKSKYGAGTSVTINLPLS